MYRWRACRQGRCTRHHTLNSKTNEGSLKGGRKRYRDVNRGLGDRVVSTSRCLSSFGYTYAMSQNIERVKLKGAPACVVVRVKSQSGMWMWMWMRLASSRSLSPNILGLAAVERCWRMAEECA
ncbi:hypothetical protein HZ326_22458 [Fusarium oxysporum f. sp. albedinis]|nr:hypothetical protein HZ326_22458 [Fusarium oxysporum f. sp. albedinis]